MVTIKKEASVPYTCHEMFSLVNDIEKYPEFIRWCGASKIISHGDNEILASISFVAGPVHKTLTTRNTLKKDREIVMILVEGPFKTLEGQWLFTETSEGCVVSLVIHFEFANSLVANLMGAVFTQAATQLVADFVSRAKSVYGA